MRLFTWLKNLRSLPSRMFKAEEDIRKTSKRLESLRDIEERLLRVEENVRNNNHLISRSLENGGQERLSLRLDTIKRQMERLEREARAGSADYPQEKASDDSASETRKTTETGRGENSGQAYGELDYFDFENCFRGDRETIKERQREYLQYFAGKKAVLDLGCGRGEFLELLKQNGIGAKGVDMYGEFVTYCQNRGLDVTGADALSYLGKIPSADGIFAGQLVEHLSLGQIIELCALAYEKLEEGSYLIMETPNPMSLAIYTHAFYMDPSHQKPIHPYTLRYLVQKAGFVKAEIVFTEASRLAEEIPVIKGEGIENAEEFNRNLRIMAEFMYGSQDYAIVAQK